MKIIHREDDTFVITKNNMPYHVIEGMPEYEDILGQYLKDKTSFEEEEPEEEHIPTYQEKRMIEYPNPMEYMDAQIKINSGDNAQILEGQKQMEDYIKKCLHVKAKYPKE